MLLPACTGFGDATLLTERFGPVPPTRVLTEAMLLAELESIAEEPTETDWLITVPLAVPAATFTTIVNVPAVNAAMSALLQTTLPVAPTTGVRQLHPEGDASDTKVVFAGTAVAKVALSAALGPL